LGAHYQSTALRGASLRDVVATVDAWLERRGFRPLPDPLFSCHPQLERGAFFFGNGEWTIVVYSDREEERRLVQELMGLSRPLLHVWLFDSDVWGYVLAQDGRTLAEFDSNPDYFHQGSGEHFLSEPEFGDLRNGAPAELCRVLSLPVPEDEIRRLQRGRAVFKESVVQAFCDRIGIGPAATAYDHLEGGEIGSSKDSSWTVECRRYTKEDLPDGPPPDLHSEAAFVSAEAEDATRARPDRQRTGFEVPFQLRLLMALMRGLSLPLRLIAGVMRLLWRARTLLGVARRIPVRALDRLPGHPPAPRLQGEYVVNERHGCRLRLPPGVGLVDPAATLSPEGLWSVFGLDLGDSLVVTCEAYRLGELRSLAPYGRAVEDERYWVGPLKARRRVLEFGYRGANELRRQEIHIVQGPRAFYVWRLPERCGDNARTWLRRTIESFAVDLKLPTAT
jgi:hypothetical protein